MANKLLINYGHPYPEIRPGTVLKFFFGPSGLSLVQKWGGAGPFPGSATELPTKF